MKKIVLSIAVVALFGTMALTSCKSGSTANADSATAVETEVPAVDTAAAPAVDTAAVADSAM
jgi:hypothetical protein